MRAVVQRVAHARVEVGGRAVGQIGRGLLVLVGLEHADGAPERAWLVAKVLDLRVFEDAAGKMSLSLRDLAGAGGEAGLLLVPNFTVAGDARKGRRPSFDGAMAPDRARAAFAQLVAAAREAAGAVRVESGRFGAHMAVSLVNDGPVTLVLASPGAAAG